MVNLIASLDLHSIADRCKHITAVLEEAIQGKNWSRKAFVAVLYKYQARFKPPFCREHNIQHIRITSKEDWEGNLPA
jgi:hypothetical protein